MEPPHDLEGYAALFLQDSGLRSAAAPAPHRRSNYTLVPLDELCFGLGADPATSMSVPELLHTMKRSANVPSERCTAPNESLNNDCSRECLNGPLPHTDVSYQTVSTGLTVERGTIREQSDAFFAAMRGESLPSHAADTAVVPTMLQPSMMRTIVVGAPHSPSAIDMGAFARQPCPPPSDGA